MPPMYPVQNIERPIGPELIVIHVLQGLLGFFFFFFLTHYHFRHMRNWTHIWLKSGALWKGACSARTAKKRETQTTLATLLLLLLNSVRGSPLSTLTHYTHEPHHQSGQYSSLLICVIISDLASFVDQCKPYFRFFEWVVKSLETPAGEERGAIP